MRLAELLSILAAIILAACAPVGSNANTTQARLVTSLAEVAGPWDIVRFDDHRPSRLGPSGARYAYINISPTGLSYTIECNYSGNEARIDGSGTLHDESDGSRIQTQMGCDPEREARDAAFFSFFGTKPIVTLLIDGRLRISNSKSELILERPEVRRLANAPTLDELKGRWVPRMALRMSAEGGHSGWGLGDDSGVVTITESTLTYSGCPHSPIRFRYTSDFRLEQLGGQETRACRPDAATTSFNPEGYAILVKVLNANPAVERTAGGGIAMFVENEVISFVSQEELLRQRSGAATSKLSHGTGEP